MGNFMSQSFRKGDGMVSQKFIGLSIIAQKKDSGDSSFVLNRKVQDARMVTFHSMPLSLWVKKEHRLHRDLPRKKRKFDHGLNVLGFKAKPTQQKIFGFRTEVELTRIWEEKPDHVELFHPLNIDEDEEIFHALNDGNSDAILISHEPSNIKISREVLQCLRPGAWLNDEVINLYLELLKERERSEPNKFLKCHFFNTFFYKQLTSGKSGYNYSAVRRWTTKKKLGYTLIECDKVFIPIHTAVHWCLAVINIKDKSFQYLDSCGRMDIHVLRLLERYLIEEARDKDDKKIDTYSWKLEPVLDLPQQYNGFDCGMFMIKYIDFYSRGLKPFFKQEHMPYFRKRTANEILRLKAE